MIVSSQTIVALLYSATARAFLVSSSVTVRKSLYRRPKIQRASVSASEYVKSNGASLEFCSDDIRRDRSVVLTAVAQSGANFEYAHDSLKRDRDFVLDAFAAASYDPDVIKFSHETVRCDRETMLEAIARTGRSGNSATMVSNEIATG